MKPFAKAQKKSSYTNPDEAPRHGPYAHCWWDHKSRRWKFMLNPEGKALVAEFIAKYPNPAAILFHMRTPACAIVLAKRWLADRAKAEEAGSAAMVGVLRAALQFQPSRGVQFSTLAPYFVLSEIQSLNRRVNKENAVKLYHADHGGADYDDDGWSRLELAEGRRCETLVRIAREEVGRALACLTDRERGIVSALYLADGEKGTLRSVAKAYGVSKERIRQIREIAFEKVRRARGVSSGDGF